MTENELAAVAVVICYHIYQELGPGLLERIYESAFCTANSLPCVLQGRENG